MEESRGVGIRRGGIGRVKTFYSSGNLCFIPYTGGRVKWGVGFWAGVKSTAGGRGYS